MWSVSITPGEKWLILADQLRQRVAKAVKSERKDD
jgi:hypothetical protein